MTENSAPPEIFKEDYSHYAWYQIVNSLESYHGRASIALPYTLRFLAIRMLQQLSSRYLPAGEIREDWFHYGQHSRSAVSFERNLSAILDLASERGDRVLLMTFATYVPADYSLEAFKEKRL